LFSLSFGLRGKEVLGRGVAVEVAAVGGGVAEVASHAVRDAVEAADAGWLFTLILVHVAIAVAFGMVSVPAVVRASVLRAHFGHLVTDSLRAERFGLIVVAVKD